MCRPPTRVITVISLVIAAFVAVHGNAGAGTKPKYVNLGDSYSAGAGLLPLTSAPFGCYQSQLNAAHLVAAATGFHLTDVSCSNASTADFTHAQKLGIAPQLDVVTPDTKLVTLTIGGNDGATFIDSLTWCSAAAVTTNGTGDPCERRYGQGLGTRYAAATTPLTKLLNAIHHRAPGATVIIADYPYLVPASAGCWPLMPIASGDLAYYRHSQDLLNSAIAAAAAATGTHLAEWNAAAAGHDACAAPSARWIEPVVEDSQFMPVHPNAAGERGLADLYLNLLR